MMEEHMLKICEKRVLKNKFGPKEEIGIAS
jgi:hypothetical protein